MAMFVHLTPEKNVSAIARSGIKPMPKAGYYGVFAMPVTRNFYASHQWLTRSTLDCAAGCGPHASVYVRNAAPDGGKRRYSGFPSGPARWNRR